jgi:hypothetical protein
MDMSSTHLSLPLAYVCFGPDRAKNLFMSETFPIPLRGGLQWDE